MASSQGSLSSVRKPRWPDLDQKFRSGYGLVGGIRVIITSQLVSEACASWCLAPCSLGSGRLLLGYRPRTNEMICSNLSSVWKDMIWWLLSVLVTRTRTSHYGPWLCLQAWVPNKWRWFWFFYYAAQMCLLPLFFSGSGFYLKVIFFTICKF